MACRLERGEVEAAEELFPIVYQELRALAASFLGRGGAAEQTLQATAVVHEVYLRLVDRDSENWSGKSHFMAVSAKAMRQILVDHYRRRNAQKRGGEWSRVTLSAMQGQGDEGSLDALDLEDALTRLEALDERQAKVVELRFFGGLTNVEIAAALRVSLRTVDGEWRAARAWLARELRRGPCDS